MFKTATKIKKFHAHRIYKQFSLQIPPQHHSQRQGQHQVIPRSDESIRCNLLYLQLLFKVYIIRIGIWYRLVYGNHVPYTS